MVNVPGGYMPDRTFIRCPYCIMENKPSYSNSNGVGRIKRTVVGCPTVNGGRLAAEPCPSNSERCDYFVHMSYVNTKPH